MTAIGMLILVVVVVVVVHRIESAAEADARKAVDDFMRLFPGKCPICSFNRHAVFQNVSVGPVPGHACPEARHE